MKRILKTAAAIPIVSLTASIVGAAQTVSLHRGKSHWSVTLTNNISDTMSDIGGIL